MIKNKSGKMTQKSPLSMPYSHLLPVYSPCLAWNRMRYVGLPYFALKLWITTDFEFSLWIVAFYI